MDASVQFPKYDSYKQSLEFLGWKKFLMPLGNHCESQSLGLFQRKLMESPNSLAKEATVLSAFTISW